MDKLLAGFRLLVVEDEMLILMMIEDMLEALGCTSIQSAGTNERALALLAAQNFDAVMLDMNLNGVSSQPVARFLALCGTPFIYSTGSSLDQVEDRFKDRPFLRKPYSDDHLTLAFSRLIDSSIAVAFDSSRRE
jgi:CheY-like chemotaxis protein